MNGTISKGLNSNQLKLVAIIAMTIDYLASIIFPGYPLNPGILLPYTTDRLTMPIMCLFITEGYRYTHDVEHYVSRPLLFAVISHFACNFTFGIPFISSQTTIFNQTSTIWSPAWELVALAMFQRERLRLRPWMGSLALAIICVITLRFDWSCIAVLIIVYNGQYRGDFRKQMTHILGYMAMYAAIYILPINPVYGLLQMTIALVIPLLCQYNGIRGKFKSMRQFFYLYHPLRLIFCSLLCVVIHGNIGVLIGGKQRTEKSTDP